MTYLLSLLWGAVGSTRIPTWGLYVLFALSLSTSFIDTNQNWGVYHYYIGSKYFQELGYFDLYECTPQYFGTYRRNLDNYSFMNDSQQCFADFTPGRYIEFIQDINAVQFEQRFVVDKGFNAPPTWVALSEFFISHDIINTSNYWIVDAIALGLTFICLWGLLGIRKALYIALFVLTFPGGIDRLWGHYAQWLWLALGLVGSAFIGRYNIHKSNSISHLPGGVMLGLSVSLAIFPIILVLPHIRKRAVILGAIIGLVIGAIIGLGNSRGVIGYVDFARDMMLHSSYTKQELCCNIGLHHSLTHELTLDLSYLHECFGNDTPICKPDYINHTPPLPLQLALALPVSLTPLGFMFAFLTLSRYYYLIMAVIPIWYQDERWHRGLLLVNTFAIAWMLIDMYSHRIHGGWVWYIFLFVLAWSNGNVKQIVKRLMGNP